MGAGLRPTPPKAVDRRPGPVSPSSGCHWSSGTSPGATRKNPSNMRCTSARLRSTSPVGIRLLSRPARSSCPRPGMCRAGWEMASNCPERGLPGRLDDAPGIVGVRDQLQDAQQHDRDGLAEVQPALGLGQDRVRVARITSDEAGGPRWVTGSKLVACRATIGSCPRRRSGRPPLPAAPPRYCRRSEFRCRYRGIAAHPRPPCNGRPGPGRRDWRRRRPRCPGVAAIASSPHCPVRGEILRAPEPVVIDAGRVRHAGVEVQRVLLAGPTPGDDLAGHCRSLSGRPAMPGPGPGRF